MTKTKTIPFAEFSDKQLQYMAKALKSENNCAEGAIRSSKTIMHCLIAYAYLETCTDKIHLASGSTVANAKMNIGDCNGFGLEHLFRGRCHWGVYKGNEALYIKTRTGEKIVVFAGGGKADSYKKILGNSFSLWIATEINLHYDAEDSETSFIKVAMGRQVAATQIKRLWDLNPSSPNHKIYKDYIDKWRLSGILNYEHFTIDDNLAITPERKEQIKAQYDVNSVWYKRDIMGLRCIAEGLIYQTFADKPTRRMLTKAQFEIVKPYIAKIEAGVDFGGNKSKHTFVATAFLRGGTDVIVLKSVRIENSGSIEVLNNMFVKFCDEIYNKYGKSFYTNFDNAEPVLANGLQIAVNENRCRTELSPALKLPILQRIRATDTLISQNRLWYLEDECESFVNAICSCQWDSEHPDVRLDDGTSDIDTMDGFEYSFEKHIVELIQTKESFIKELLNGLSNNY